MGKIRLVLLICCLLVFPQAAVAWGGGGSSAGGSRLRKSPPRKRYTPPPVPAQDPAQRHVVSSVSYYVQFKSQDGWFPMEDPRVEDRQWLLKVAQAPVVKKLSATKYEVLGNFEGKVEGGEDLVPAIVRFTLEGAGEKWKVRKTKLYSVNGTEI